MSIVTNKNKFAAQGITDLESLHNNGGVVKTLKKLEDEGNQLCYVGDNKELLIVNPQNKTALFSGINFKTKYDIRIYFDDAESGVIYNCGNSTYVDTNKIFVDGVSIGKPNTENDIAAISLSTDGNKYIQVSWKKSGNHYIDFTVTDLPNILYFFYNVAGSRVEINYNFSDINFTYFSLDYKLADKIKAKEPINLNRARYNGMTYLSFIPNPQ